MRSHLRKVSVVPAPFEALISTATHPGFALPETGMVTRLAPTETSAVFLPSVRPVRRSRRLTRAVLFDVSRTTTVRDARVPVAATDATTTLNGCTPPDVFLNT